MDKNICLKDPAEWVNLFMKHEVFDKNCIENIEQCESIPLFNRDREAIFLEKYKDEKVFEITIGAIVWLEVFEKWLAEKNMQVTEFLFSIEYDIDMNNLNIIDQLLQPRMYISKRKESFSWMLHRPKSKPAFMIGEILEHLGVRMCFEIFEDYLHVDKWASMSVFLVKKNSAIYSYLLSSLNLGE